MHRVRAWIVFVLVVAWAGQVASADESSLVNTRRPQNDQELKRWLQNMVWHHRFSIAEIQSATGLTEPQIRNALVRWKIDASTKPPRASGAPLLVLPYPGGRHPRIGFLDGAIRPQRETKISVFTPWDDTSYVVVDVPEAIWSNLGLTYLAHTHIPTIWDAQGVKLEPLEWQIDEQGQLSCERRLPNGIEFGTRIWPGQNRVRMRMWITNGTQQTLTDLRVQNCVLLKMAKGFEQLTNDNKIMRDDVIACHSPDRKRWIITAWKPNHRTWANNRCPCLHSDPRFADCAPGETQYLDGWLSFYEGDDIEARLRDAH